MSIFKKRTKEENKEDQMKKSAEVKVAEKSKNAKKSKSSQKEDIKKTHGTAYQHLIRPIITEQSAELGIYNQYVFEVSSRSNKTEVKKAIESLYGVKPIKINILNIRGKSVRFGRRFGKMKNWKKAVITLKSGDKIDVYEGV